MKLYELTKPELDKLRELCNFTPDEMTYFNANARQKSNVEIAVDNYWSDSKVSFLARAVRRKIRKINTVL